MPSYMKAIVVTCNNGYCKERATHEVFDTHNQSRGKYCRKHAENILVTVKHMEEQEYAVRKLQVDKEGSKA